MLKKIQLMYNVCSNFIHIHTCNNYLSFFFLQQAQAEQEEEFISNTLLKKIQALKKEKEKLAVNYEQEEEFLTNDLSRKLMQVCSGWCDGTICMVLCLTLFYRDIP